MRVRVLGNIENRIKSTLSQRLSKSTTGKELSANINEELTGLNGISAEYIKYNKILGWLLNAPATVKLHQPKGNHSINASLSGNKNIVKYTGSVYNVLFEFLGQNKLTVESNLSSLKSSLCLFQVNSKETQSLGKSAEIWKFLKIVNKNMRDLVLQKYLSMHVLVGQAKKSLGFEKIINPMMKLSAGVWVEDNIFTNKIELSVNPIEHIHARVLGSIGICKNYAITAGNSSLLSKQETSKESSLLSIDSEFYAKVAYSVTSVRSLFNQLGILGSHNLKRTPTDTNILARWKRKSIQNKSIIEPVENKYLPWIISKATVDVQGEVEGTCRLNIFSREFSGVAKTVGMLKCTIEGYGVLLGGLITKKYSSTNNTTEHFGFQENFTPAVGFSYTPKNSFIDSASVYWPWASIKRKSGFLNKLHAFEISVSKEY
ncbi:hypothetical protein NEAUS03_1993 [Nematocida ausubeli]|nr:hypothetical protein NEAUS03_1993 [Nematocida ausubeli]